MLHPALDILIKLRARYVLVPDQVKTITISLDADAARPLVYDRPTDSLQSKFSLPFAAAVTLADGAAGLKQFSAERVRDPDIQSLMKRVKLLRQPASTRAPKIGIDTKIEIETKNGVTYGARDRIARGHPARPASRGDIEEKFRHCAAGVLSPRQTGRFLKNFWQLEHVPSIASWLHALRPPRR